MPTALLNDVELYYETEGNGEPGTGVRHLGSRRRFIRGGRFNSKRKDRNEWLM